MTASGAESGCPICPLSRWNGFYRFDDFEPIKNPQRREVGIRGVSQRHCLKRDSTRSDTRDEHRGVRLAVAFPATHVFAAAELLDDDLLVTELVDDPGGDPGTLDDRRADGGSAVAGDQQDFRENQFSTGFTLTPVDDDPVALVDPELVAAVFKNCVHQRLKLLVTHVRRRVRRGKSGSVATGPRVQDRAGSVGRRGKGQ